MGALKWRLKASLCNLCTSVYKCEGNSRRKMTTILGNHGQLWTSTLPFSTQTLPTEKNSGGINFGKDYSMITD